MGHSKNVKIGGREGSCHLTKNVTVGQGGVKQFNTGQIKVLDIFIIKHVLTFCWSHECIDPSQANI